MAIEERGKNTWRITVCTGKINGKYQRETITFHGLKSEAKLKEAELKQKVKNGGIISNKKITFKELTTIWAEQYGKNLAPKTYSENLRLLEVINEHIGEIVLINITPIILTALYNKIREKGKQTKTGEFTPLSEKTLLNYYCLVNSILNKAIEWEFIERNPNSRVPKPKVVKHQAKFYDVEQVKKLLRCLENEPLKCQAVIYLTLDLGAREGEITGLDWSDINLETGKVKINKVTQYIRGEIIEKPPKNNSSIRENIITQKTLEILKLYKKEQLEKELLLGDKWVKTTKVFTRENGGLMFPATPYKMLKRIQKKYNLPPLTFHGLRHTLVSLLANEGVPLTTVSKIVGHSDISTTARTYTHIFDQSEVEAKNKLEKIIS
jgi:integrase